MKSQVLQCNNEFFSSLLDLLNEDKTIDRRALGRKVFGNQVMSSVSAHQDIGDDMSDYITVSTVYQRCRFSCRSG